MEAKKDAGNGKSEANGAAAPTGTKETSSPNDLLTDAERRELAAIAARMTTEKTALAEARLAFLAQRTATLRALRDDYRQKETLIAARVQALSEQLLQRGNAAIAAHGITGKWLVSTETGAFMPVPPSASSGG